MYNLREVFRAIALEACFRLWIETGDKKYEYRYADEMRQPG